MEKFFPGENFMKRNDIVWFTRLLWLLCREQIEDRGNSRIKISTTEAPAAFQVRDDYGLERSVALRGKQK